MRLQPMMPTWYPQRTSVSTAVFPKHVSSRQSNTHQESTPSSFALGHTTNGQTTGYSYSMYAQNRLANEYDGYLSYGPNTTLNHLVSYNELPASAANCSVAAAAVSQ